MLVVSTRLETVMHRIAMRWVRKTTCWLSKMLHKPESYFLPTAGGEYLWASLASRWWTACPDSPGTSRLPPCTPYTPGLDVYSPGPCLCPVRAPRRPSAQPPTEGPSGALLTWAAATGGRWRGHASWEWRRETGRPLLEDWCGGTPGGGAVTAVCVKRKTKGEFIKVFNSQFT